jgi:hypothetical protein
VRAKLADRYCWGRVRQAFHLFLARVRVMGRGRVKAAGCLATVSSHQLMAIAPLLVKKRGTRGWASSTQQGTRLPQLLVPVLLAKVPAPVPQQAARVPARHLGPGLGQRRQQAAARPGLALAQQRLKEAPAPRLGPMPHQAPSLGLVQGHPLALLGCRGRAAAAERVEEAVLVTAAPPPLRPARRGLSHRPPRGG